MTPALAADATALVHRFTRTRQRTEELARGFEPEDCVVQTMDDVSPTKWHLAHTSWFFENFVLGPGLEDYREFHPGFGYLFNSYYEAVGPRHARPERGLLTRPTLEEVFEYRDHVDEAMRMFFTGAGDGDLLAVVELGIHHEQQHQELILTDIKHVLGTQPMQPGVVADWVPDPDEVEEIAISWIPNEGGHREIGHAGTQFAFDNETPRHDVYVQPFEVASRPVTNAEFSRFVEDGGYERAEFWLADGWQARQEAQWESPLYWHQQSGQWTDNTLGGRRPLEPNKPTRHVSYFEADAYARWAGTRLPTEQEWETAHDDSEELRRSIGSVWEWTSSAYSAYPGFEPPEGALGGYNGKFMCNQMVLRGGSTATPGGHTRGTYRNFFYPHSRWQFSGIRLAR